MKTLSRYLVLALVITAGVQWFVRRDRNVAATPEPVLGQVYPNLRVTPVDGDPTVKDLYTLGEVSTVGSPCFILHLFEPHCPACRFYGPNWRGVDGIRVSGIDVPVVHLGIRNPGTAEDVAAFAGEFGFSGPTYVLNDLSARRRLSVTTWPRAYLMKRGGEFIARLGHQPSEIEGALEELEALDSSCKV